MLAQDVGAFEYDKGKNGVAPIGVGSTRPGSGLGEASGCAFRQDLPIRTLDERSA